jgi:outer membrane protein
MSYFRKSTEAMGLSFVVVAAACLSADNCAQAQSSNPDQPANTPELREPIQKSTTEAETPASPPVPKAPAYSAPPASGDNMPLQTLIQKPKPISGKAQKTVVSGDQKSYNKHGIVTDSIPNKPVQLPQPQPIMVPSSADTRQYPAEATRPVEIPPEAKLVGEPIFDENAIILKKPELKALISVDQSLSPFGLDADYTQPINLRETLITTVNNNLDLAISRTREHSQKLTYLSSLGAFLPDLMMGYQEFFLKGELAFPFKTGIIPGTASTGTTSSSGFPAAKVDTPFFLMNAGVKYNVYRGGKILFGAMRDKHSWNAAKSGLNASLSDVLLDSARDYYNLVLAEALLQIRIKAVDTSEEQVRVNTSRFENGLATNLDVLQSRTQLSRDRQSLVDQQVNRRATAIQLADKLNINLGGDLTPVGNTVRKVRLVSTNLRVPDLLRVAIENRPELKQNDELRRAAKATIIVNTAPLQPTVALSGNVLGAGPPSRIEALYALGIAANWNIGGLGTVDTAKIALARSQARQAALEEQKQLVSVLNQVRTAYIRSLDAERNIVETTNEVNSSAEELRLAQLRFANGLGTNLDIITAQRDYTQALIDKAQAIINFNIAQVQMLHDVGLASIDNLSSGRVIGQ